MSGENVNSQVKSDRRIKKFYGKDPEFVVSVADLYIGRYHYRIQYLPKKRNGCVEEFPFVLTKYQTRTVRGKRKDIGWFYRRQYRTLDTAQDSARNDLLKGMDELESL